MKILFGLATSLLLLGNASAFGQQGAVPLVGEVMIRLHDGTSKGGRMIGRTDQEVTLSTRLDRGFATVRIPRTSIREVLAPLPPGVASGLLLWRTGKLEEAAKRLGPELPGMVRRYEFLPDNLAAAVICYADTRRQLGDYQGSLNWLKEVAPKLFGSFAQQSRCISAIGLARLGQIEQARAVLDEVTQPSNSNPEFALYCLAQAAIYEESEQILEAAESLGKALALMPLASPEYPEALFQAAGIYRWIQSGTPPRSKTKREASRIQGSSVIASNIDSSSCEEQIRLLFPNHYWTLQLNISDEAAAASKTGGVQ
jgi:tetratricopeptide (TPR) repeat protein